MKRTWVVASVVGAVVVGSVAWRLSTKAAEARALSAQQQSRKGAPAQVSTTVAGPRDVVQSVDLVGTVESPFVAKLSPRETGKITDVAVREGDDVTVGQALVRLDPAQLDALVLQQRSAVAEARSRLAQALVAEASNNVGIESSIRVQGAGVTSSRADLEQTRQTMGAKIQTDQNQISDANAKLRVTEAALKSSRAGLASAKANWSNAKSKSDRLSTLESKGYVSKQELDDARTEVTVQENLVRLAEEGVNQAEASVDSAKAQLDAAKQTAIVNKKRLGAELTAAEARNAQNQATWEAARANRGQTKAYRENIAALRAAVGSAEAELRQVESRRADLVLRSPIDGTVTARSSDLGDVAGPGQPVVTVQYLRWLYVTVSAPIGLAGSLKVGQTVDVRFDAVPGETLKAPVEKINPAADPVTRQFTFRIRIDNPARRFRPGMFAQVGVTTQRVRAAVVVPREAIKDGALFVLKKDGTVERRTVQTGSEDADVVQVTKGLEPGEEVVRLSYAPLRDGQKAKAAEAGAKK
ncbi:MAG: efflux RND transporter periplasmic adaptor subunit [Armatimonadetes bacterium]|nr:efflux RND transporter periplasmic adaptor subunit [Armatimonadota bacterium]